MKKQTKTTLTLAVLLPVVMAAERRTAAQPPSPPPPVTTIVRPAAAQPPPPPPVTIIVQPAAAPVPALKYRLVPERRALVPGNAAVFYHRANLLWLQYRMGSENVPVAKPGAPPNSVEQQLVDWANEPLAKLPRDDVRNLLARTENVLTEIELGGRRTHCDWEFDLRTEGFSLLIPEIQATRSLARLVVLRVRVAMLDGKVDDAIHWLQTGFVLGRHVADGPTLIQGLVGVAIDRTMKTCLEDLVQIPGTPSLYWALANRPRPLVDMRVPLEGERDFLERELPALRWVDEGPWSVTRARQFTDEFQRKIYRLVGMSGSSVTPGSLSTAGADLGIAAMAAKVYPEARRALVDRGRATAEVDAMPVVQVAMLYTMQEYRRIFDDSYKWLNVPYWQSHDQVDRPWRYAMSTKLANPLLTMLGTLAPAINAARLAPVLLERQLDAIQCIEAIRLHAAAHGGVLPDRLEEMTDAPVPIDAGTGRPFTYTREGDSATLTAPAPPGTGTHPSYLIRYVLKLAK